MNPRVFFKGKFLESSSKKEWIRSRKQLFLKFGTSSFLIEKRSVKIL